MDVSEFDQRSNDINSHDSLNSTNTSTEIETCDMCVDDSLPLEIRLLKSMFRLQVTDVYKSDQCRDLMNYLRSFSSNLQPGESVSSVSQIVDNDNCIQFFHSYVLIVTEDCDAMLANISQRHYLNFIKLVMALWNLSDKFDSLCARMAAFDIHTCLIRLIGRINVSPVLLESKQIQLMVMSVLGILHNINNKLHYTRSRYRDENLVQYLMPLAALDTTKELIGLKTAALLLLAFLVNENENSVLNANDEHIMYIINILKSTLESGELYSIDYGYHSLEILTSLRHIASPDNNKRSLINNGVLPLIEIVLKLEKNEDHEKEIVTALKLLWTLSFSNQCIQLLNGKDFQLKHLVDELSKSDNQGIVSSAKGILWNMKDKKRSNSINNLILNDGRNVNKHGHVMISYQHSTQDVMVRIKDKLLSSGYKVWMDVDHMRGSFVDAMAEAIENASVLLLGLCQAFKNSPHCQKEVKYAYNLHIRFVPVMLEPGFSPDGWLGLMCATLIHTDFIDPTKFDKSMEKLQHQLGALGKTTPTDCDFPEGDFPISRKYSSQCTLGICQDEQSMLEGLTLDIETNEIFDPPRASKRISKLRLYSEGAESDVAKLPVGNKLPCMCCSTSSLDTSVSSPLRSQVLDWTSDQCHSWFSKQLKDIELPIPLNGALLFELADMYLQARESYFAAARDELKLEFAHRLQLGSALRKLDENIFIFS